ncbi:MAG: AAA family ATPase [Acidimicrobiia bacterium]
MDVRELGQESVLRGLQADVAKYRERHRLRALAKVGIVLALIAGWLWYRLATNQAVTPGWPHLSDEFIPYLTPIALIVILAGATVLPLAFAGRSPHVLFRPSEISTTLDDVVGLGVVRDEVIKTLNLFLAYKTFRDEMGGNPRKAILFEGKPGTGKTHMAKAMAHEAGVPFLFVSASSFQSMYYGQTNRKIRSFFKELRKHARKEGGAIGFIEEIDAIAGARSGMNMAPLPNELRSDVLAAMRIERNSSREGITGVVNELLVQLQSFDDPTFGSKMRGKFFDWVNQWLPRGKQLLKKPPQSSNILVIGATNRAADLDPALLRPGRFDRSIHFDLPSRAGRREIIDYYLQKKSHGEELDKEDRRDQLAAMTFGYSPVMLEHLFDESLVWALRSGRSTMSWSDVQQAKLTEEIGLKQPVEYTDEEKLIIATHEAGHAVVAYLVGPARKLEVLSIIKRRESLGLLAHSEAEERFTKTRSELVGQIKIALGGMTAEELFFGESGTGPGSDLAAATRTAAHMVGSFGMAGSLVSFQAVDGTPLGNDFVGRVLADEEGRVAVDRLLTQSKNEVRQMLDEHRNLVEALRDALIDREELVGDEIVETIRRAIVEDFDLDS